MVRILLGTLIALLGLMAVLGGIGLMQEDPAKFTRSAMIFSVVILAGGVALIYSGAAALKARRRIAEAMCRMLRESGTVDTGAIAGEFGITETRARRVLVACQSKGLIPYHADASAQFSGASHACSAPGVGLAPAPPAAGMPVPGQPGPPPLPGAPPPVPALQRPALTVSMHEPVMKALKAHQPAQGLFVAPSIPDKKLFHAANRFRIPPAEQVLGLIDCTSFGSCKNGLAFGGSSVYFHNGVGGKSSGQGEIAYQEFPYRFFGIAGGIGQVYLGNSVYLDASGSSVPKKTILSILLDVKRAVVTAMSPTGGPRAPGQCPMCAGQSISTVRNLEGGTGGAIVGGALFGIVGAMVGSVLTSKTTAHLSCDRCGCKWVGELHGA